MSRSQNLRKNVINQMLEGIARHHSSPLPPQAALAEMFNISRTTVRQTLHSRGVLEKVGENWVIVRDPGTEDGLSDLTLPN